MKDSKGYDFERVHARNKREDQRKFSKAASFLVVAFIVLCFLGAFGLIAHRFLEAINF